jgi:hypothetical protein
MNTARGELYESRWILSTDASTQLDCPEGALDPLDPALCQFADAIGAAVADSLGSLTLYEVRNGAADPYPGPLAEGAGKLDIGRAIVALRDGLVIYSAASGTGIDAGTGPRDLQGSWQVGAITAGSSQALPFVLHAAPGAPATDVTFALEPGQPSDGSQAIPASWSVSLPGTTSVGGAGNSDQAVTFRLDVPADAEAGTYTGTVLARTSAGATLRIPAFASVVLHDPDTAAGNRPGRQASIVSEHDVFAKDDTLWPSAAGAAAGAAADWRVYAVELAAGLGEARFSVVDTAAGDETYDLYVYDDQLDLLASSHPFAAPGITDVAAQRARGPSTEASPTTVVLHAPAAGRHYLAVNRARIGRGPLDPIGDMGSFRTTLDEVGFVGPPDPSAIAYEGDHPLRAGAPARLAARLTDAAGGAIAGRLVTFTFDSGTAPCPGGTCQATTGVSGLAQLATDPIELSAGIHEVHMTFGGDAAWSASSAAAFTIVVGAGIVTPPASGSGAAAGGGWFIPEGATAGQGDTSRAHFAVDLRSGLPAPTGEFRYRDRAAGLDLTLERWSSFVVDGSSGTGRATGTARTATGALVSFELTLRDVGEPGKGHDTVRLRFLDGSYDRAGVLGGGNLQVRAD